MTSTVGPTLSEAMACPITSGDKRSEAVSDQLVMGNLLHEGNPVNLLEGCFSLQEFFYCRFPQKYYPRFVGLLFELGC